MTKENDKSTSPTMQIIKKGTCPSSSGKSELTYHFGVDDNGTIHVRIYNNTGKGFFNQDWISLDRVIAHIKESRQPVTGYTLEPLFKGRSINTPFFLVAALYSEGLLKKEKRVYLLGDTRAYLAELKALIPEKVKTPAPAAKSSKARTTRPRKTPTA